MLRRMAVDSRRVCRHFHIPSGYVSSRCPLAPIVYRSVPSTRFTTLMKHPLLLFLACSLSLSSCTSYDSWNRTTTGMSLGGMFGSAIGGILGGPRGADVGMLLGGATGAAVGAASAEKAQEERTTRYESYAEPYSDYDNYGRSRDERRSNGKNRTARSTDDVRYGRYDDYALTAVPSDLEVRNVTFADADGNHVLTPGERAYITFEIHNRSTSLARNVAPILSCDYSRINISPTAIIGDLPAGSGIRYRATVVARRNARARTLGFDIAFPDAQGRPHVVHRFDIDLVDD